MAFTAVTNLLQMFDQSVDGWEISLMNHTLQMNDFLFNSLDILFLDRQKGYLDNMNEIIHLLEFVWCNYSNLKIFISSSCCSIQCFNFPLVYIPLLTPYGLFIFLPKRNDRLVFVREDKGRHFLPSGLHDCTFLHCFSHSLLLQ